MAAGAAVIIVAGAIGVRPDLPVWAFVLLLAGGGLCAASAIHYRYRLRHEHEEIAQARKDLEMERAALEALRQEVARTNVAFEKRRQSFETRLMSYHEWTEFPDLAGLAEKEVEPEAMDQRDKELVARVQAASDEFFAGFQSDRYSENGQFQPRLLVQDIVDFVTTVARVYKPDSKSPLLETSVEKLLKAVNHISLQLLFQLEQLPLNVKDYSLAKAYENIRTATKFYDYYKTVSPYLPYASYTLQLGRLVLGANPILTGTWLLGSEIMRQTGKRISKHYVDRYTLKLTGEAIRIIANEAAMTFDEDYRYRDPNWVYGLELTEMVYVFPLSRETLQEALFEVGNLPLRNSYDRIYLYRCLALSRSPEPQLFVRMSSLSQEQRRQIAERLERFFRHHIHGRQKERVEKWASSASERLGIALRITEGESTSTESEEVISSAVASLGTFLVAVKERPVQTVRRSLQTCKLASFLPDAMRGELIDQLVAHPPMFFDYPNLDPESPVVDLYFSDLVALEVAERPPDLQGLWAIREAAVYFRVDPKEVDKRILSAHQTSLLVGLDPVSPEQSLSSSLTQALIQLLEMDESPLLIYSKVTVEEAEVVLGIRLPGILSKAVRWLVATQKRLVAIEVAEELEDDDYNRHRVIWELERATPGASLERSKGLVKDQLVIRGGQWLLENMRTTREPPGLAVPADPMKRFDIYYGPLREWLDEH